MLQNYATLKRLREQRGYEIKTASGHELATVCKWYLDIPNFNMRSKHDLSKRNAAWTPRDAKEAIEYLIRQLRKMACCVDTVQPQPAFYNTQS